MKTPAILFLIILLSAACKTESESRPNAAKSPALDTIISATSIHKTYDSTTVEAEAEEDKFVEDPMEFMPPIENESYLGIVVGNRIKEHQNLLNPGTLATGEGAFDVHYISYKTDTLGYVYGKDVIESIHIWDSRGATNNGIRTGMTFSELKDILKEPKVHGSELESRVYVFHKKHRYQLDYYSMEYDLNYTEIPDSVVVKEIMIVN